MVEGLRHVQNGAFEEAEEAAQELIRLRHRAEKDEMGAVIDKALNEVKADLSKKDQRFFGEFEVILAVLAVEDPLERWRALGEKISEKWPRGVSAVEAIRKERV